jgi:prolyl oligopeptidase
MASLIASCDSGKNKTTFTYPESRKDTTVKDNYFGTVVNDPYRWLEDDNSDETKAWVTAQNQLTFDYLQKIPFREKIKQRLEKIWNYEKKGAPFKQGNYYYFYKNDGLQNQYVLYRTKDLSQKEEVFIDPNKFSTDGTVSLSQINFTKDGSLAAYMISEGGSDWNKIIVINTESGKQIEDTLVDVKFSGIAWKGNDGFYYSSYDKPKKGSALSGITEHHKIFYHKLGTPQKNDQLIFGGEKQPYRYISAYLTEDERFLVISCAQSTTGNELFIKDLSVVDGKKESKLVQIVKGFESDSWVIDNNGSTLLVHTNYKAPNNRVVSFDFYAPQQENWKYVIPETKDVLIISTCGGYFFASYQVDVQSKVIQ